MQTVFFPVVSSGARLRLLHGVMRTLGRLNYWCCKYWSPAAARTMANWSGLAPISGVHCREYVVDGMSVLEVEPKQSEINTNGVLLYCHGGGYVIGSHRQYRTSLAALAKACGQKVYCFDYRLAPEHPYPKALEDAKTVFEWLVQTKGYLAKDIVPIGDSAGGHLVIALCLALRNDHQPMPSKAVSLFPAVDTRLAAQYPSYAHGRDAVLSYDYKRLFCELAFVSEADRELYALLHQDLKGLPPLLIQVGTNDTLYDEVLLLIERLTAANNKGIAEVWQDMTHGWHSYAGQLDEADRAIRSISRFVLGE